MSSRYVKQARLAHQVIFDWAKETLATRQAFSHILLGTIHPVLDMSDKESLRRAVACRIVSLSNNNCSSQAVDFLVKDVSDETLKTFYQKTLSPLRVFSGHPGILQHIAGFAGYTTDKKLLCTARGLLEHEMWWDTTCIPQE